MEGGEGKGEEDRGRGSLEINVRGERGDCWEGLNGDSSRY